MGNNPNSNTYSEATDLMTTTTTMVDYITSQDRLIDHQINTQLSNEHRMKLQASRDHKQREIKILFLGLQDSDRMLTIQKIKQYIVGQHHKQKRKSAYSSGNNGGNHNNNNNGGTSRRKSKPLSGHNRQNTTTTTSTAVLNDEEQGTTTSTSPVPDNEHLQQSQSIQQQDTPENDSITNQSVNGEYNQHNETNNNDSGNTSATQETTATATTTTDQQQQQQQQQQHTVKSIEDEELDEIDDGDEDSYDEEAESVNKQFKEIIHFHTLNGFQQLLQSVTLFDLDLKTLFEPKLSKVEKNDLAKYVESIRSMNFSYGQLVLNEEVVTMIESLWKQPGIQGVYERRHDSKVAHFSSLQCLGYFMENLKRITTDPYIPSDDDINFAAQYLNEDRSGIEEVRWDFSGQSYRIFNVKGKYNDCRKWLFQFEGVDVVCFLCPLGDYDLPPDQKGRENVLKESLNLFDRMCNSDWFRQTPVMLLMTKFETFREKIYDTDMICCFHDYNGGCVYQSAVQFVTQKFLNVRKKKKTSDFDELDQIDEDQSCGIYPIYTSSNDDVEALVNNIGGTLKNILYLKRVEMKKQAKILEMKRKEEMVTKRRSFGFKRSSLAPSHFPNDLLSDTTLDSPRSSRSRSNSGSSSSSFFSGLSTVAKNLNLLKRGPNKQ